MHKVAKAEGGSRQLQGWELITGCALSTMDIWLTTGHPWALPGHPCPDTVQKKRQAES